MTPKKIGLIVAAVTLLLLVVGKFTSSGSSGTPSAVDTSSSPQAPGDEWQISEGHSPVDDSKLVTLSLNSGDVIQGPLGLSRPTLVIRCKENKTDVYVVTGMAASVEDDDLSDISPNHHRVRLRLDRANPQTVYWYGSNDDKALFAGNGEELAKELAVAQTLTFEFTPFDASTAIAKFDLAGLDTQLPKVADACGWNVN